MNIALLASVCLDNCTILTCKWGCHGERAGLHFSLILAEVTSQDVSHSRPSNKQVFRAPTHFVRVNGIRYIQTSCTPTYNSTYTQELITPAFTHEQPKPWKRSLDPALYLPSDLTRRDKDNRLTRGRRDAIPFLPQSFIPYGR